MTGRNYIIVTNHATFYKVGPFSILGSVLANDKNKGASCCETLVQFSNLVDRLKYKLALTKYNIFFIESINLRWGPVHPCS